jgi:enamine deaminase RidA (YjgF/YER057c/UK114 family)
MPIQRIDPPELAPPQGYTHAVKASSPTTLYLSGQGGYDAKGVIVGPGDHRAQTCQAVQNVLVALRAGGASWRNVVKATYYVVNLSPDAMRGFALGLRDALGADAVHLPAATLVGVAALFRPEMLVEIDVTAVLD